MRALFALVVAAQAVEPWPTDESLSAQLPRWFVDACATERGAAEEQRRLTAWRRMSHEEKAANARFVRWTVQEWLHWMCPEECPWTSPRVAADGRDRVRVTLEVDGWPSAHGAVDWMLRAAGADDVHSEDD